MPEKAVRDGYIRDFTTTESSVYREGVEHDDVGMRPNCRADYFSASTKIYATASPSPHSILTTSTPPFPVRFYCKYVVAFIFFI